MILAVVIVIVIIAVCKFFVRVPKGSEIEKTNYEMTLEEIIKRIETLEKKAGEPFSNED